jgi:hypothetical protein
VHLTIELVFTQHAGHHVGGTDKINTRFDIPAKITGGKKYNRNNFRICYFTIYWLFISEISVYHQKMRILQRFL